MNEMDIVPTKKWIMDALLDLLNKKSYNAITIDQIIRKADIGRRTFYRHFKSKNDVLTYIIEILMDDFAQCIMKHKAQTQQEVMQSYFVFWEKHIDILLLLKRTELLYFIEDRFLLLMYHVAVKIHHIPESMNERDVETAYETYKYAFTMKLAGIWKATLLWCIETPRKSPSEMGVLIDKIFTSNI